MKTIIKINSFIVIVIFAVFTNIAFALEDTCSNEIQPLVSSGSYYICSFAAPGEMDTYRISVSKGDRISVAVAVLQAIDKTESTPTPRIKIINPDGSLAANKYDSNGVFDDATMNSAGLATIIVTDDYRQNTLQYSVQVNCTGFCGTDDLFGGNAYEEGLQLENSNNTNKDSEGEGTCDRVGNYYICSFTAPGEMDAYRILVSKGDRISVAMAVLQAADETGSIPTPKIRIINPDGSLAASRYDSNGVFDDAVINSTGLATIIVTDDYRQNTLKYSLQVNCTGFCGSDDLFGGNSYEEGYKDGLNTSASSISAVSGELDTCPFAQPVVNSGTYYICSFRAPGEMNAYRITVNKEDRISVAVAVLQAIDETGSIPTPKIRIINPDGSLAASRYDTNGVFDDAVMNSAGLATIIITDDYRQNTLQYSVQINCVGTCSDSSDGDDYLAGYQGGLNGTNTPVYSSPNPTIKANDKAKIEIGLDSGSDRGKNADWWLVANTPSGLFSYDLGLGSWVHGINVTYQNALFSFNLFEISNISALPEGTDSVYFGVDLLMNEKLDMEQLHYDSVGVTASDWDKPTVPQLNLSQSDPESQNTVHLFCNQSVYITPSYTEGKWNVVFNGKEISENVVLENKYSATDCDTQWTIHLEDPDDPTIKSNTIQIVWDSNVKAVLLLHGVNSDT